jgi:hypothetical protein
VKDSTNKPIKIPIVVEFSPQCMPGDATVKDAFKDRCSKILQELMDGLVEDLQLPARIVLSWKESTESGALIRVAVTDYEWGEVMYFSRGTASNAEAEELACSIANIIIAHREALISDEISARIRETQVRSDGKCLPELSDWGFRQYLRRLVSCGFGVGRGTNSIDEDGCTVERWDDVYCLEAAICSVRNLRTIVHVKNVASHVPRSAFDAVTLNNLLDTMRERLFYELGVNVPVTRFTGDRHLAPNDFRIQINDLRLPPVHGLTADQYMVHETVERLKILNVTGAFSALNPNSGEECAIVTGSKLTADVCRQAGLETSGPMQYLVLSVTSAIRRHAAALICQESMQNHLDLLALAFPHLVKVAIRRFGIIRLTQVARALVQEEISVRDLRSILESLLSVNATTDADQRKLIVFDPYSMNVCHVPGPRTVSELQVRDYVEHVRGSLKRAISYKYARTGSTLVVYLLRPELEARFAEVPSKPLHRHELRSFFSAVRREIGHLTAFAQMPAILTSGDIRRTVRTVLERDFPQIAVLAYTDLSPDMNIQPVARIEMWDSP